jgi:hypothetical protein
VPVDGPLADYRLDEVAGKDWGEQFFLSAGAQSCSATYALMQGAEYMQMEGLRWLCAAKIACAIRDTSNEEDLCGLFGVPLERMDRYEEEVNEACASAQWASGL